MNTPPRTYVPAGASEKNDISADSWDIDNSTKINVAYYAMRIISHRIDISRLYFYSPSIRGSHEFTPAERGLTLELLDGIQRHARAEIQNITESVAAEYIDYLTGKVEELADIKLTEAGYDAGKAELILEKLRQAEAGVLEVDVSYALRAEPDERDVKNNMPGASEARHDELERVWDSVFVHTGENDFVDAGLAIEKWQHYPFSQISHHGHSCCELAREWLFSMDASQLQGASLLTGPRWLRHRYTWGPSRWPIHWCEIVRLKTLDTGALAALAHEIFEARGVKSFPMQMVQQFSREATRHFQKRWIDDGIPAPWIIEDLIYHEGCAVVVGHNEIKIWDPAAGWWVNPAAPAGYGGVLALRLFSAPSDAPTVFRWGKHDIIPNRWQRIERMPNDFEEQADYGAP